MSVNAERSASPEPQDFSGQVALVTGAGSGIGAAVAALLAARGAEVVVADIDMVAADRVANDIRAGGGQAYGVAMDVSVAASVEQVLEAIGERHGGLDLAVNNAGITGDFAATGELSLDSWHRVMNINLNGLFYCHRYELPQMQRRGKGAIVNLSSICGLVGMVGWTAYCASKHGVIGLTRSCALDYATKGIRVNAVAPGCVDTPILRADAEMRQKLAGTHPMNRIASPRELAELIAFLLSDRAAFVTGSVYSADGGFTSR